MRSRRSFRLKTFGIVLTPAFRMCLTIVIALFYSVQVIVHMGTYEATYKSAQELNNLTTEEFDELEIVENSFVVVSTLVILLSVLQFACAWFDYQRYERWLLQSNALFFGLVVGLLSLSKRDQHWLHSSLLVFFFWLNCLFCLCVPLLDLFDLRPLGADQKLDLLQQVRGAANALNNIVELPKLGKSDVLSTKLAQRLRSNSKSPGLSKYSTLGNDDDDDAADVQDASAATEESEGIADDASGVIVAVDAKGNNSNSPLKTNASDPDTVESGERRGAPQGGKHEGSQVSKQFAINAEDVVGDFRVKLDRLVQIGASGCKVESSWSTHSDRTWSVNSSDSCAAAPNDVRWDSLSFVEHRIDSSSCHIYTALWQGVPVIVKLIKADRVNSPVSVSEFEAEAVVLSCARHRNIVRMLGSGRLPRRFIILELLDGGSMSHALGLRPDSLNRKRTRKFTYLETLMMARDLASALEYLHCRLHPFFQVIHRDIKPDNIGWTSDGTLKLFDFGLCSVVLSENGMHELSAGEQFISYDKGYKMTGNTGTLRYMAPEVALNQPYHSGVDVYSFSIVIWQVFSGEIPFQSMGKRQYMDKVVRGKERPELPNSWALKFRKLLARCWEHDKNKRPNFPEIVTELNALIVKEQKFQHSGWRRVYNSLVFFMGVAKRFVVRFRPFFSILFVLLLVLASTSNNFSTVESITIIGAAGIYLSVVSGLRYHLRAEKQISKQGTSNDNGKEGEDNRTDTVDIDADDIISMSVGLESGSSKISQKLGPIAFTFNPLGATDDSPLHGL